LKFRFDPRLPDWRSYVPLLDSLSSYRRRDFNHDLVAGLVLGVVTIPQAVAYAFLAGLPAQAGLYACLVPMVLYAIFGSSRELVVGPVAVAALMVVAAVSRHAEPFTDDYASIALVLCLQAGIFLWLLRLWQMGGVVNLLSQPVIGGFVNAAAILIILSQIPAFLGLEVRLSENGFLMAREVVQQLPQASLVAAGLGGLGLILLWMCRHYAYYMMIPLQRRVSRRHPITNAGPVLVAIISLLLVYFLELDTRFDLRTVGALPAGLPSLTLPPFNLQLWLDLAPASAMVALVVYVESYAIGSTLATRRHRRLNGNQELIALGVANVGAAFSGAYPVAGQLLALERQL
jgi:sulfate permease, SulP family